MKTTSLKYSNICVFYHFKLFYIAKVQVIVMLLLNKSAGNTFIIYIGLITSNNKVGGGNVFISVRLSVINITESAAHTHNLNDIRRVP